MRRRAFELLVHRAVRELPYRFRRRLENVAFRVKDWPDTEELAHAGCQEGEELLGLYRGVPLPQRGEFYDMALPDEIILYQEAIEARCLTPEEIRREVKATLLHEVAHYFGIEEAELRRLGRE